MTDAKTLMAFAWDRWTAAERRLSHLPTRGAETKRATAATEFWRRAYNAYEARVEVEQHDATLAHLATSVDGDAAPHFIRGGFDELPENHPDLGFVMVPMPKPRKGKRT